MATHYGIWITEETHALIAFLNGGVLPDRIIGKGDMTDHYFCFSVDSKNNISVLTNPIRTENSLWRDDTFRKNDRILLIG